MRSGRLWPPPRPLRNCFLPRRPAAPSSSFPSFVQSVQGRGGGSRLFQHHQHITRRRADRRRRGQPPQPLVRCPLCRRRGAVYRFPYDYESVTDWQHGRGRGGHARESAAAAFLLFLVHHRLRFLPSSVPFLTHWLQQPLLLRSSLSPLLSSLTLARPPTGVHTRSLFGFGRRFVARRRGRGRARSWWWWW